MSIQIIRKRINSSELQKIAEEYYKDIVKGVADIRQNIIALGGDLQPMPKKSY